LPATAWRLSTYCREHSIDRIDLLKIDIEGGEYDVVSADLEFLKMSASAMLIEFHNLDEHRHHGRLVAVLSPEFEVQVLHTRGLSGIIYARRVVMAVPRS
jgi:hypothetical protein